jgi:hypothetical protein
MRVLLDDNPCSLEATSLEAAISAAAALAGEYGRLIVEVVVDGKTWSEADLEAASEHRAAVEELRLTTAEPRALVVQTLEDASGALLTADELQREAAELIDADNMDKAMERLGHAFQIWGDVQQSVLMSAQVLAIDPRGATVGGRPLEQAIEQLIEQLREMGRVLKSRDPVGISDALLYEFPEVVQEWRAMLHELRENIQSPEGA